MGADEKSRPHRITGENNNPVDVPAGEFYIRPKARPRRMMQNHLSGEARRVYECLELPTLGFNREEALIWDKDAGKDRPLTPADIGRQTGLKKQNIRRALIELEREGLVKYRGLANGPKVIYSLALPLPASETSNRARLLFPEWFPPELDFLKAIIKRQKLNITFDEVIVRECIPEAAEVARICQTADLAIARLLERIGARPRTKEETNETNIEIKQNSDDGDDSSVVVEARAEIVEDHHHHDSVLTTNPQTPKPPNPQTPKPPNPQTPKPPNPHLEDTPENPSRGSLRVLLAKEGIPLDRQQADKVVSDLKDTPIGYYLQRVLEQREQNLLSGKPFKPGLAVVMAKSCRDKWLLELDTGPVRTLDPRAQRMQETANRWRRRHGEAEVQYGD